MKDRVRACSDVSRVGDVMAVTVYVPKKEERGENAKRYHIFRARRGEDEDTAEETEEE